MFRQPDCRAHDACASAPSNVTPPTLTSHVPRHPPIPKKSHTGRKIRTFDDQKLTSYPRPFPRLNNRTPCAMHAARCDIASPTPITQNHQTPPDKTKHPPTNPRFSRILSGKPSRIALEACTAAHVLSMFTPQHRGGFVIGVHILDSPDCLWIFKAAGAV